MRSLIERIKQQAVHVGGGIVKVDAFLNHQVDVGLMREAGESLAARLSAAGANRPTRVITAEASGIAPAAFCALVYGVPLVYARKRQSLLMPNADDFWRAQAVSRTKAETVTLWISRDFLGADDRIIVIDDFLASGSTTCALIELAAVSGARLIGCGFVIEKPAEMGRERVQAVVAGIENDAQYQGSALTVPLVSLAKIHVEVSAEPGGRDEVHVGP